jgi:anaerobic magnesium-protoporphyrin IX monomethyl ester cyclase
MHVALISTDDDVWGFGIRSISTMLREKGHRTTMIFAGSSAVSINESVIEEIAVAVGDSEIIGISSLTTGSERAKKLIEGLRPLRRMIVWGGMYPTLFPEDCAAHADIVCRGEGEEFMLDLTERVASGIELTDIPNGVYMFDGHLIMNNLRPLIAMDNLPLPDFAFEKEYILNQNGKLVPNTKMREYPIALLSGSRGCGNGCAYCSNSALKSLYRGKGCFVRKMAISRFVEVSRKYRTLFPRANRFSFMDEDLFARTVEEIREFAATYPDQVGLPFTCFASPRKITEEKLALASKSGMVKIYIGLESGSERIRQNVFNRYVDDGTLEHVAVMVSKNARGKAEYFLILGNPYEERQDLLDGISFLRKLPPPFKICPTNLVFIPGTKLYEKACHDGIIEGLHDSAFDLTFFTFGFVTQRAPWKRKNLYLNILMLMMAGKFTGRWMGHTPRFVVPYLVSPRILDFFDRHTRIIETTVLSFQLVYRMRKRILNLFYPKWV